MTEDQIDFWVVTIGFPWFAVGFILWGKAAWHMFSALAHHKSGKDWGRYLGISMLFASFFTDEGNMHRLSMWKYSGFFVAYIAISAAIFLAAKQFLS